MCMEAVMGPIRKGWGGVGGGGGGCLILAGLVRRSGCLH